MHKVARTRQGDWSMEKIGKFGEVPLHSLSKFFENGFTVAGTGESGMVFLKRVHAAPTYDENPVRHQNLHKSTVQLFRGKYQNQDFFFNTKTRRIYTATTLNIGEYSRQHASLYNLEANSVYFIRDAVTGNVLRAYFNPAVLPVSAFKGTTVFCPAHRKYEQVQENNRTACGLPILGFPVQMDEDDGVFAYKVTVQGGNDNLIVIDYIYLDIKQNRTEVYRRVINTRKADTDSGCSKKLPKEVYDFVIRILVTYTRNVYGIDISYKNFRERNFCKAIIKSPFEPALFFLKDMFPQVEGLKEIDLQNSGCFKAFCDKLGVKAYRTFRRAFNESLRATPCFYIATKELKFQDKNIINEMLFAPEMDALIPNSVFGISGLDFYCDFDLLAVPDFEADAAPPEGYATFDNGAWGLDNNQLIGGMELEDDEDPTVPCIFRFYAKMAKQKSERTAWNLLKKNIHSYAKGHESDIKDAAEIYFSVRRFIDADTKKKILREGLCRYNHDLLVNIQHTSRYQVWLKNQHLEDKPIVYKDEERRLEKTIDEYDFHLVRTPSELFMTALKLHNCVGSYMSRILKRNCLIVIVEKDGETEMCIEVRGKLVQQCQEDHNRDPKGENLAAFKKWLHKCHLEFCENHF